MRLSRRGFLAGSAGAGSFLAAGAGSFGRARAQAAKTLVFAAAGTVTSSWDPTSQPKGVIP